MGVTEGINMHIRRPVSESVPFRYLQYGFQDLYAFYSVMSLVATGDGSYVCILYYIWSLFMIEALSPGVQIGDVYVANDLPMDF